jgi:subtilisin-like proprotein convertase family protein
MNKFLLFFVIFTACFIGYSQEKPLWEEVNNTKNPIYQKLLKKAEADKKSLYTLNETDFKQRMFSLQNKSNINGEIKISIPNSTGTLEEFTVKESSNFAFELQALYPDIRAYSGTGITDPSASISFSISPIGIQTIVIRGDSGSEFIEPLTEDKKIYVLSTSKNTNKANLSLLCKTSDLEVNKDFIKKANELKSNNGVFKTMRLALSCTGEYTNYFGGTVAGALAGMNATMTRVNAVLNKDLALKLELIANTNLIIYTDANTDPYSNEAQGLNTVPGCTGDCPGTWNKEVQSTITNIIGEGNYDIGHLLAASGGGGDAGCIGCVCSPITNTISKPIYPKGKGSAYTSPADSRPEGSTFDIDFVAHEMGHQLGANHTFSYDVEGTGVNIEPGSGSTIMGYAGITDYDVQNHSDDYFGYASILQIQNNLALKTCPLNTTLSNQTPKVNAGLDFTIPKSTPFTLTGTGSDPNGGTMTYCWEQYDSATSNESNDKSITYNTKLNGPLFRSFSPSASPIRYMPALNNVLLGQLSTTWESVSSISRTLNFTLTGRDNAPLGLGQTHTDAMTVTVNSNAGPFIIDSQNIPNLNLTGGATETIEWSVNNTNSLPGSANVNIKLSTDGGLTFPTILISNAPNNGSAQIKVPNISATDCRILIEPKANIYYAVNSQPFTIKESIPSSCNTYLFATAFSIPESETYSLLTIDIPSSAEIIADINVEIKLTHPYLPDVQLELVNPQGIAVKLFDSFCGASNNQLFINYDDSGSALSCTKTTLQTVIPAQSLGSFNENNPEGKWTLRVRDSFSGDKGVLESASLTICTKSTSLATTKFKIDDFNLYPNPNKGIFTIQFDSESTNDINISIYDLAGRLIFDKEYSNEQNFKKNIELNKIQAGVYIMEVTDGDKKTRKKIIIE